MHVAAHLLSRHAGVGWVGSRTQQHAALLHDTATIMPRLKIAHLPGCA